MGDSDTEIEAKRADLCLRINTALLGCSYEEGLEALAAVAARLCTEQDYPQDQALGFIGEFLQYVDHEISEIPAETTVTIPAPPGTN